MARSGMANPIYKLRELTSVGTADYSIGTVTYWSDDHLQRILDNARVDIYTEPLTPVATVGTAGTATYFDYYFEPRDVEQGTAFILKNSLGTVINTSSYTVNYDAGHVSFGTADQRGTAFYLSARAFDMNAAAANVWRAKAANVAAYYDFSADGHSMSRSQMVRQFQEMAQMFAAQANVTKASMYRSDDYAEED